MTSVAAERGQRARTERRGDPDRRHPGRERPRDASRASSRGESVPRSSGFGSSVAIPFMIGEQRAGLFVYSDGDERVRRGDRPRASSRSRKEVGFGVAYLRSVHQSEAALEATIAAINAQRATEHALSESEQRFRLAFEHNMAPMSFSDLDDRMIAVNDALLRDGRATRATSSSARDTTHFTHPEDVGHHRGGAPPHAPPARSTTFATSQRYLRKDGRIIVSEVSRSAARDPSGTDPATSSSPSATSPRSASSPSSSRTRRSTTR